MLLLLACTPRDVDGDGALTPMDCNDEDAAISPDVDEACGNNIDDNCDGAAIGCGMDGWMNLDDAGLKVVPPTFDQVHSAAIVGGRVAVSVRTSPGTAVWIVPAAPGEVDLSQLEPIFQDEASTVILAGAGDTLITSTTSGSTMVKTWAIGDWATPTATVLTNSVAPLQPWLGGDLTGDGIDDLLVSTELLSDESHLWILPGPISGAMNMFTDGFGLDATSIHATAVAVADLDGDGTLDLVSTYNDEVAIFRGPIQAGSFDDADTFVDPGAYPDSLAVGDTTGDGTADLLVGATDLDLAGSGIGATGASLLYADPLTDPVVIATFIATDGDGGLDVALPGDLDGDGTADAAVVEYVGAHHAVRVHRGPLEGTRDSPEATLFTERSGALDDGRLSAPGDLDGDGTADLLVNGEGYSPGSDAWGAAWLAFGGPGF